jgi:hypothetical protein
MKTTPEEAAAAKRHLSVDLAQNLLLYKPVSTRQGGYNQPIRAQQVVRDPTDEAKRTAQWLASIYDAAVATGSKDIDQLQSLDAVINRLTTTGMIGGPGPFEGKRIYTKTKPRENEAAKPYLRYDSFTKTLKYSATPIGGSRGSSATPVGSKTRPQSMSAGRETRHRTFSLEGDSASSPDRARRNAEIICTVFNMAVASGAEKVQDVTSVDRAVQLIMTGVYGGGIFREVRFSVDGTPEKAAAAKPFLTYDRDSRSLRYVANTRPPPAANETRPTVMNVGRAVGGGVTFAGRTFANVAEMEKAIRESHEAAKQALATRNAQAFVSTYNAAMAAGAKELDDVRSADQALKLIMAGVNGGGPFKDRLFVVDATPEEAAGVRPYIEFDPRQQILIYKSPYR